MTWRIVVISTNCKLDLKLSYMVIRGSELKKIHISEIAVLILENTAISLTAALLCELNRKKIKVIFCDEARNPYGELIPYYGSHDSSEKIRQQINWDKTATYNVWTRIVKEKIKKQRDLLLERGHQEPAGMLDTYIDEVCMGDVSNREGHAAKVYFNAIFGQGFSRRADSPINSALNYGYSILLSACNREIVASGYLTQLGIFHDNVYNPFNLGSDLMEPFRPIIDRRVLDIMPSEMNSEVKREVASVMNVVVRIAEKENYLLNAIRIYVKSVFDAINEKNDSLIEFYDYEA